jgi:hypothetical protein
MNLNDLSPNASSKKILETVEKRFGFKVDMNSLTVQKAVQMLTQVRESLNSYKRSNNYYAAEKSREYMEKVLIAESLVAWLNEAKKAKPDFLDIDKDGDKEEPMKKAAKEKEGSTTKKKPTTKKAMSPAQEKIFGKKKKAVKETSKKAPKKKMSVRKMKEARQTLKIKESYFKGKYRKDASDVMKTLAARAGLTESINSRNLRSIMEGETEAASLILAAKDLVDSVQDMLEDLGTMMTEKLLPLSDKIREEMGAEMADNYKNQVSDLLNTAFQSMQATREGMDQASRILTGEESGAMTPVGGEEPAAPEGGELGGAEVPPEAGEEVPPEGGEEAPATADTAAGGAASIGRERR